MGQVSGAGSTLRLSAVTVPEMAGASKLTGTLTVGSDGSKTMGPRWGRVNPGVVRVNSGPGTISEGGRCVGKPDGYGPSEECKITSDAGGLLGACGVFDTSGGPGGSATGFWGDAIILPDFMVDSIRGGSDCPVGVLLGPGDSVGWSSDSEDQGTVDWDNHGPNGCSDKGLCGLPHSSDGPGGGWQICFA
jgi:hypothetical protein